MIRGCRTTWMERLSGQSLRLILEKKGQLELSHAYHIGIDLLDALNRYARQGVIHRDVKPDNIFLHRTMAGVTVTKLLDFGIVSLLDERVRETGGRFLGTLRLRRPGSSCGARSRPSRPTSTPRPSCSTRSSRAAVRSTTRAIRTGSGPRT